MRYFDIEPFALPNCEPGQVRFEEPRDIAALDVTFKEDVSGDLGLSYLCRTWPGSRVERISDLDDPCTFVWIHQDDWFNGTWQSAAIQRSEQGPHRITLTFQPLTQDTGRRCIYRWDIERSIGKLGHSDGPISEERP